jgi:peptide/nickel transport system permease protein
MISIPLGLSLAKDPGSKRDRRYTLLFTILFSIPGFWIAMLLMFFFCNPDFMNLFPVSGVMPAGGFPGSYSPAEKFIHTIPYLIIPTITYTYSSFAFLTGNVKNTITAILKEDYIRTAYAKGLSQKRVLYKHALPNALLPMITIFSHVFPYAISGSVVLETIFNIPGMGLTIFQSIGSQDFPVVITVFLFTGIITMTGFFLSDILYAIADPRINFLSKTS